MSRVEKLVRDSHELAAHAFLMERLGRGTRRERMALFIAACRAADELLVALDFATPAERRSIAFQEEARRHPERVRARFAPKVVELDAYRAQRAQKEASR